MQENKEDNSLIKLNIKKLQTREKKHIFFLERILFITSTPVSRLPGTAPYFNSDIQIS
jgi:hypothetical protein